MTEGKWFGKGFDPKTFTPPPPQAPGGQARDVYNGSRFIIKMGEERPILFQDGFGECIRFVEHRYAYDPYSKRRHYFPCPAAADGKPCHLCATKVGRYRAVAFTITDRNGFAKRDGSLVKNVKRLFVVEERHLAVLIKKSNEVKNLRHQEFKVARNYKDAVIGDEWTPIKQWTREDYEREKIDFAAYDYDKVIPFTQTAEEQKRFLDENPEFAFGTRPTGDAPAAPHEAAHDEAQEPDSIPF
jgi:hypothetical protein